MNLHEVYSEFNSFFVVLQMLLPCYGAKLVLISLNMEKLCLRETNNLNVSDLKHAMIFISILCMRS